MANVVVAMYRSADTMTTRDDVFIDSVLLKQVNTGASSFSAELHYTDIGYEHHQRTSSQQFYTLLYNKFTTNGRAHSKFTTNGQKFATSQHLDMSRCWALALRCGKFVVQLL